jgi:uncharacterized membrane protein YfcA
MIWLLLGLGAGGGFVSGLVGLGGAILMIPLLLYVPPLVVGQGFTAEQVAGITIVQAAAAALSGALHHWRHGHVLWRLVLSMGVAMAAGSLIGGFVSEHVPGTVILAIFAAMAAVAAISAFIPLEKDIDRRETADQADFSRPVAATIGLLEGTVAGMAGVGGGIILIPVMTHLFKIPTRFAVGSNLAIVFLSALAGMTGKALGGQIEWMDALVLVGGALPAAQAGAHLSERIEARHLRVLIHLLIGAASIRLWVQVATGL